MPIIKPKPLYAQIKHDILHRILSQEWLPHTFLPNETELTKHYGVSIGTLRKALEDLTHEKFLIRQQGRGTIVADINEKSSVFPYALFFATDGSRIYSEPNILRYKLLQASDDIALKLELKEDDKKIILIERALYRKDHEEEHVLHDWVYIPRSVFPAKYVFKKSTLPQSLFAFYLEQKKRIVRIEETISACMPDRIDVKLLKVTKKNPLCEIHRIAYDLDNVPIEYRIAKFDPQQYIYKLSIT